MISYLEGTTILKQDNFIILQAGGVGYKVFLSEKSLKATAKKEKLLKLFTFLRLREPTAELYGFLTFEELRLFEVLNDISGVGPKTALSLTSFGTLENLKRTLEKEDTQIKGLGKKKLQKLILELTGKIKELTESPLSQQKEKDEALEALLGLGFPAQKAKQALSRIPKEIQDAEAKIKEALKILGQ